jgi:hypothetical protein
MRRDCEPDRGKDLLLLARVSLVCGFLSLLLFVPILVGLPFGIMAGVMARADLRKMGQGLMDRGGEEPTQAAYRLAVGGVVACMVALAWLGPFVALNLIDLLFPRY